MKLEEIKISMDVKVIEVEGLGCWIGKYYIGKTGKVINILSDVPYPIVVDFGHKTNVFKPEELEEV